MYKECPKLVGTRSYSTATYFHTLLLCYPGNLPIALYSAYTWLCRATGQFNAPTLSHARFDALSNAQVPPTVVAPIVAAHTHCCANHCTNHCCRNTGCWGVSTHWRSACCQQHDLLLLVDTPVLAASSVAGLTHLVGDMLLSGWLVAVEAPVEISAGSAASDIPVS